MGLHSILQFTLQTLTFPSFQTELLQLSRTNFSEAFQLLVHLKVVRLFVESVLRYGLPANYVGIVVKASSLLFNYQ
jgi:V-type H+-transporting ATPase subunit C